MNAMLRGIAACLLASSVALAQGAEPPAILAAARAAMGGDAALDALRSFIISGSIDRRFSSVTFTLYWTRPDKFLIVSRHTEGAPYAPQVLSTYVGFNGDDLIYFDESPRQTITRTVLTPDDPATAARGRWRVETAKAVGAELLLPLFAAPLEGIPLRFETAAGATLPGGSADGLKVTLPGGTQMSVFLDSATHLPARLTWPVPIAVTPFTISVDSPQAGDSVAGPGLRDPATGEPILNNDARLVAPTEVIRNVTTYPIPGGRSERVVEVSDYRVSNGVRWPRKFTVKANGEVIETLKLSSIAFNAKIKDSVFKPTK